MTPKSIIAIISAAALCACSQIGDQPTAPARQLAFAIAESRAEIADAETVKAEGFTFSAVWDGQVAYGNGNATWNGSSFDTHPQVFWPNASKETPCQFFAVACADAPTITFGNGQCSFAYISPANAADQADVLVAAAIAEGIPADGIQKLTFTHALTKINFSAYVEDKPENDGFVWRVSSISIKAKGQGEYAFGKDEPWTLADETADYEYLPAGSTFDISNGQTWDGQYDMMLIPQAGPDLVATVSWDVYSVKGNALIKTSAKTATKHFAIPSALFAPGASLRFATMRLPNIGEKTLPGNDPLNPGGGGQGNDNGDADDDTDDNNMSKIEYGIDKDSWK